MRRWLALALLVACNEQPSSPYRPCPGGSADCEPPRWAIDRICAVFEDASLCGPACHGFGQCGDEVMGECLLNLSIAEVGLCLPTCSTAADCPDEGMECQACIPFETCVTGMGLFVGVSVCVFPD